MLAGHFAVALAGKRAAPSASLGTLLVAAMAPDLVWAALLASGVSSDIALSHSLAANLVWAGLLAGIYYRRRRDGRAAWIIAAAALSHWLLDAVAHPHPDMWLAPGVGRPVGLGLWSSLPATLAIEGGMWAIALALYISRTDSRGWAGIAGFWAGVALLTLAWGNNISTPPPANGVGSLVFFGLFVAWAYWMNVSRLPSARPLACGRGSD